MVKMIERVRARVRVGAKIKTRRKLVEKIRARQQILDRKRERERGKKINILFMMKDVRVVPFTHREYDAYVNAIINAGIAK